MVDFAIKYRAAIDAITSNHDLNLRKYELADAEWVIAIFKHATLFFSCDTPSISTVIPAMDHIDTHLATATQNLTYPASIRAALAIGKATLNRYYNKMDYSEVYRIAMGMFCLTTYYYFTDSFSVLHPRHKLHYFKTAGWEDGWIKTAHAIVRAEFYRTYAFMDIDDEVEPTNEVREQVNLLFL
ncbi:hypothetical protein M413DRAFT_78168 [Hebeloma cylindrosporum]|uniref:Uncharacterized protein n=1 Tax=Hebeloma cylindrosporum TaxID=76867 RepID=A0A0C3BWD1_HEBCY|nr:hypothetical protein M413DRAFT_78168 [Hebeloma cylindrosporum h7]